MTKRLTLTVAHLIEALTQSQFAFSAESYLYATPIRLVTQDSRQIRPNGVYVAFVGERVDGHRFVDSAFASGAIAAIVEQVNAAYPVIDCRSAAALEAAIPTAGPVQLLVDNSEAALQQCARHWRQLCDTRIVGITGSVGKTTTKELVWQVLAQSFNTLKSEKNFNNEIGLPLTLLGLTPEHERVVLEMGMYVPGDIALLASIAEPNVGVVTNVGTVHIERAGSQDAIMRGKRELVEALPANGVAILNNDDPRVRPMAEHTAASVITYGLTPEADLYASSIVSRGLHGMQFGLNWQGETVAVELPIIGRHSVLTALRAAAVGLVEGMTLDAIVQGLAIQRDQLRMVVVDGPLNTTIVDDTYNASPQSTVAALDLLADLYGRKVAVLGDMLELGSDEVPGHQRVGRRAAEVADVLVTAGPRARTIAVEALHSGFSADCLFVAADADAAIPLVQAVLRPRDTILVKGSRGARLDKIMAALMAQKETEEKLDTDTVEH